ncbi:hypothetical protein JY742_10235 [Clostridioides difficile]|nr:hypothetical protein [Clostridioides difficile]
MINKLESTIKEETMRYNRINGYLEEFMKKSEIDKISNLTEENIDVFIKTRLIGESATTVYTNLRILRDILKENKYDIDIDTNKYSDLIKFNVNKYFTRNQIKNICSAFLNAQDKFIVYALFNGIMGKDYVELRFLKVTDIAKDYSYINLPNRRFLCDDYMKEILEDVVEEDYYTKSEIRGSNKETEYKFNMDCEYVIKTRPTKMTDNGMKAISKNGIQNRLKTLSIAFEDLDIHLTGKTLQKSGIIYDMYEQEAYECMNWTIPEIKRYLELKCLKGDANNIYKAYHQRYHNLKTNRE